MSFWAKKSHRDFVVELLRVERSEQAKARAVRRSGIWLKISVACQRNVTFSVASHQNSQPYPIVAFAPRFCIGSSSTAHSLNKTSTSVGGRTRRPALRMTYSGIVWRFSFETGDSWIAPTLFLAYLFSPFLSTPTKQIITFFKKMYVLGVFKG